MRATSWPQIFLNNLNIIPCNAAPLPRMYNESLYYVYPANVSLPLRSVRR